MLTTELLDWIFYEFHIKYQSKVNLRNSLVFIKERIAYFELCIQTPTRSMPCSKYSIEFSCGLVSRLSPLACYLRVLLTLSQLTCPLHRFYLPNNNLFKLFTSPYCYFWYQWLSVTLNNYNAFFRYFIESSLHSCNCS
jgi:hypothetical protein